MQQYYVIEGGEVMFGEVVGMAGGRAREGVALFLSVWLMRCHPGSAGFMGGVEGNCPWPHCKSATCKCGLSYCHIPGTISIQYALAACYLI